MSKEAPQDSIPPMPVGLAALLDAMTRRGRVLTVARAAAVIGCHPATVRRMIARGVLPAERQSPRVIRVAESDLLAFRDGGIVDAAGKRIEKPITMHEAAEMMGTSAKTIYRAIRAGHTRCGRDSGRRVWVDADEVAALAEERGHGRAVDRAGADTSECGGHGSV